MIDDIVKLDKAFRDKLSGMTILDRNGQPLEVPVMFISPPKENEYVNPYHPSALPCLVFYRNGMYPDMYSKGYDNNTYIVNIKYDEDGTPLTGTKMEGTFAYNVYYGIRVYYEYKQDGARLNFLLNKKLRVGSYLTIDGEDYDINFLSYKNPEGTYRTFGEVEDKEEREFVDQYLFKVEADFDFADGGEEVQFSKETKFSVQGG